MISTQVATRGETVGARVAVGRGVSVGAAVGAQVPAALSWTPHEFHQHLVSSNNLKSTAMPSSSFRLMKAAGSFAARIVSKDRRTASTADNARHSEKGLPFDRTESPSRLKIRQY